MGKKKVFLWKKWLFKLAKNAGIIFIAGMASVYGNSEWYLILAPAILALENYLKHV